MVRPHLKTKLSEKGASNVDEIIQVSEEEFYKIPEEVINSFIEGYWTRLEECLAAGGGWVGHRGLRMCNR